MITNYGAARSERAHQFFRAFYRLQTGLAAEGESIVILYSACTTFSDKFFSGYNVRHHCNFAHSSCTPSILRGLRPTAPCRSSLKIQIQRPFNNAFSISHSRTAKKPPHVPFQDHGGPLTDDEIKYFLTDREVLRLFRNLTKCDINFWRIKDSVHLSIRGLDGRREYANQCLNLVFQSYRQFGPIPSARDVVQEQLDKKAARTEEEPSNQQSMTRPTVEFLILENDSDKRSSSVSIRKTALLCLDKFSEFCRLSPDQGGLDSCKLIRNDDVTATLVLHGHQDARQAAIAAIETDASSKAARSLTSLSADITLVSARLASQIPPGPNGLIMMLKPANRTQPSRKAYLRLVPTFLDTLEGRHWAHMSGSRVETKLAKDELDRLSRSGPQQVSSQQDAATPYPVAGSENDATCKENLKSLMRTVPSPVYLITSKLKSRQRSRVRMSLFRGLTVSSFSTVTIEPSPVVCFNVKEPSRTLGAILMTGRFYAHVLAANGAGAALANLFTKAYDDPAEPFIRAGDIEGTKLISSYYGPRFTGKAIVGTMYCTVLSDLTVTVGDHKVIFAKVEAVSSNDVDTQDDGIAYAHRTYIGAGSPITPQQLSTEALDPALAQQQVSQCEGAFGETPTSTEDDDLHSESDGLADDFAEQSDEQIYKAANTDAMDRFFEDMERVKDEEDDADVEPEDTPHSADPETKEVETEDVRSENVRTNDATSTAGRKSEDLKSEDVKSGDVKSEDVKSRNAMESDDSEYSDDIAPRS